MRAEFKGSYPSITVLPKGDLPEFAFIGRSNVGKSSLINELLHFRLAQTSKKPGKTRAIHFYQWKAGGKIVADLPGYGYAKVSKAMRKDWGKMAEDYLLKRRELALFIQLVDSRHKPTELDRDLSEWLSFHQKNTLVVATKTDKMSNNQLTKAMREIETGLPESKIIAYSAETGKGREAVWREIESSL